MTLSRSSRLPRGRGWRCCAYGWFEAGWLRTRVVEVPIDGLPDALDGLRIGHLSDFHLGAPLSRGQPCERARRRLGRREGARISSA